MNAEHLDMQTPNGAQLNIDALYKICPSCFTESKGEDGALRHVVDFNKLRSLLGDMAVDDAPESYDFTWVGKREAQRGANARINKTLRPCVEESVDWDKTQNLYIEGDNLEVLKLLQNSYMGKVKMIYIDPPYNTGNDFIYEDNFTISEKDYDSTNHNEEGMRFRKNTDSNGRFHSDWCSMMYSRLSVARTLLSDDGIIYISIDDNEQDNLKKICNEIFGESNFVTNIIWEKADSPRMDAKLFSTKHDFILLYAKNLKDGIIKKNVLNDIPSHYDKVDDNGRRYYLKPLRYMGTADAREDRPNLYFAIKDWHGNEIYPRRSDGSDGRWRWSKDKVAKEYDKLVFIEGRNGTTVQYKVYADDSTEVPNETIWYNSEVGSNRTAMALLKSVFNGEKPFSTPKPIELIRKMLKTIDSKDSLILDFFSGSATTAHAVFAENALDEGNRRFIMVQAKETIDEDNPSFKTGYKYISEIGKERIRRAGKKIKEESPLTTQDLDIGFRVLKCDSSNMKDVYFSPQDYSQTMLFDLLDNIKDDRTDLDLLFDCMLRWGITLDLPMTSTKVDGCKIHNVNEGALVACFEGKVTEKVIDAICAMEPNKVVFRDSSFEEAAQKMNLFELFKQKLGWEEQEVRNNIRVI